MKGYKAFEEEDLFLAEDDLDDIQSDLAQLAAEISFEEKKEEIKWESVQTFRTYQPEPEEIEEDYWLEEFQNVFNLYLKSYTFDELIRFLCTPYNLNYAVLSKFQ